MAAREKVRVARALDGLDTTDKAFKKGELSYSKVRAMTRVASKENEEYSLMIVQYDTAQQMEQLVGVFRSVCAHDDCEGDLQYVRIELSSRSNFFRSKRVRFFIIKMMMVYG